MSAEVAPLNRFMALLTQLTAMVTVSKPVTDAQRQQLAQDLPRDVVRSREQAGQKLSYVDGWYVISRANEVFGPDGWSYTVETITEVYRGTRPGKDGENVVIIYEARVTVRALGVERSDVGVGLCDAGPRALAQGIEKARKEAATDGLKRALRTFGPSFGLALYDKEQRTVGLSVVAQEIEAAYNNAQSAADLATVDARARAEWKSLPADEQSAIKIAMDRARQRVAGGQTQGAPTPAQAAAQMPITSDDVMVSRLKGATSVDHLLAILLAVPQQTSDRVWTVAVQSAATLDGTTEEQLRSDIAARKQAAKPEEWAIVAAFLSDVLSAAQVTAVDSAVTKHAVAVKTLPDKVQRLCTSTAIFHRMSLRIASAPDDATLKQIHANLATFVTGGKLGKVQAELLTNLMNERAERLAASQDQAA